MDTVAERPPADAARAPVPPGPGVSPGAAHVESHETSFLEPIERVFATLRRMATDYAHLAVMDLRRATIQLAWLVGACILISVLVVTAWLAGVVAIAVWLLGAGMSWPAVLAIAGAFNLVGAGLVVWRIKGVFEHAPFSATLRQIKAQPPQGETDA
jgi:uncharacterized membrane protein YqjE